METVLERVRAAAEQVGGVLLGKERQITEVLLSILADGHILLEDIPGVGKTTLALAFSKTLDLDYRRVQFTPDVLPSDLTGFSVYRREREEFVYQPGSVFCNLLLADELNRTSPKTQSALLEVMEERRVTVEGVTREVPSPFLVIATQNPPGSAGTQPLPESQADRFAISLSLGYPDPSCEMAMALAVGAARPLDRLRPELSREELLSVQADIHQVYMKETVSRYLVELIAATRRHPSLSRGASPRATIALVKLSKASAWYQGRGFVTPLDVLEQFPYAVAHRLILTQEASLDRVSKEDVIREIAASVRRPPMELRR